MILRKNGSSYNFQALLQWIYFFYCLRILLLIFIYNTYDENVFAGLGISNTKNSDEYNKGRDM